MAKCTYLSIHNNGRLVAECSHPERYRLDTFPKDKSRRCVSLSGKPCCLVSSKGNKYNPLASKPIESIAPENNIFDALEDFTSH